jgi:LacI family transcriptional regulator
MGAIRALRQIGWQVPEDISVVGFDDIESAAYQNPSLTTVRQPLREMGRAAAEILLKRINRPSSELHDEHVVEPELVVRETTARAAGPGPASSGSAMKKRAGKR